MKHIVIVGGGFAGLNLAKSLTRYNGFGVTLVDRNNYHFFPPLLYQLATGFLHPGNIAYPYRRILRDRGNIRFRQGTLIGVVPDRRLAIFDNGPLHYDELVLAVGVATNYFGMENVRRAALPMKTLEDAMELRDQLLLRMEDAARGATSGERRKPQAIVVAGAGPSGVEISGMLADMRRSIVLRDYPELAESDQLGPIYLVDGGASVLASMSEASRIDAIRELTHRGVDVRLHLQVADYIAGKVVFTDGEAIETDTLIWTAGVTGTAIQGVPSSCYGRGNRLITDEINRVKGLVNVYAIGDGCIQNHEARYPAGHPQLAQVAIQQGKNLAANLTAVDRKRQPRAFAYQDKGSMAIIARNRAVADLPGGGHFRGFLAWVLWMSVHLISLVSHRNRITTFYNWAYAYVRRDSALRLILRPQKKH